MSGRRSSQQASCDLQGGQVNKQFTDRARESRKASQNREQPCGLAAWVTLEDVAPGSFEVLVIHWSGTLRRQQFQDQIRTSDHHPDMLMPKRSQSSPEFPRNSLIPQGLNELVHMEIKNNNRNVIIIIIIIRILILLTTIATRITIIRITLVMLTLLFNITKA